MGSFFPLLITAFFALSAAAAELLVIGQRKFIQAEFITAGWQLLWITPLSYLLFMMPLGVILWIGRRVAPQRMTPHVIVFVPTLVSVFSVVWLFYPALHKVAIVLLALGIATQLTRVIAPRHQAFGRRAWRTVPWLAVTPAVLGAGACGSGLLEERRALSALPAVSESRPNVLLIILDTVRSMSLSLYGYERITSPEMERLAAQGVVFGNAVSTSPWTLPGHASILTGRYAHELSAGWTTPLDDQYPTLAEILSNQGYLTAGFVANLQYTSAEKGLGRGFAHYEDFGFAFEELLVGSSLARFILNNPRFRSVVGSFDVIGRKTADKITDAFLNWLPENGDRPFFAFLNYYDAHEPYLAPVPYDTAFGEDQRDKTFIRQVFPGRRAERASKELMTQAERDAEQQAYDAAIVYLDSQLGRLFDELQLRGYLENTIVIVTSDHGELFGEHGLFAHGNSLYLPLLHVPLIISYPGGVPGGQSIEGYVTLRDLAATVLDLADVTAPEIPGNSLAPLWGDGGEPRAGPSVNLSEVHPARGQPAHYPAAQGSMYSLVANGFHYIRAGDGTEELFDITADRGESHNLANDPDRATLITDFRRLMDTAGVMSAAGDSGQLRPINARR